MNEEEELILKAWKQDPGKRGKNEVGSPQVISLAQWCAKFYEGDFKSNWKSYLPLAVKILKIDGYQLGINP
jgi:hypothetical protein